MGINGNEKDTADRANEEDISTLERRSKGRLSDAEANAIIDGILKQVKLYLGDKLLKGLGWLLFSYVVLAVTEVASGGKISLGAALKFIVGL